MSSQVTPVRASVPEAKVSRPYLFTLGFAQFGIFAAILAPIFVSMAIKAEQINPGNPAAVVGSVLPIGAVGALISNPIFGALSDRTRTRWGRRRPWLLGGVVALLAGLAWMGTADSVGELIASWLFCQIASNAASAALLASFADNVPEAQRGRASGVLAVAQNISILAGLYLAVYLQANLALLFLVPGIIGVVSVVVYVIATRDQVPETPLPRMNLVDMARTFWTNPLKFPDFGLAWWSRFLITLATYMFTTYRLIYMQDHLGLEQSAAVAAQAQGVLYYTLALLVSAYLGGWLSDKLGRRKIFVMASTGLFAVGLIVLAHADSVAVFYAAEVLMGFAYGVYGSVDNALTIAVLPNPELPGKDLGVINIAQALPQSLAPGLGLLLLGVGAGARADNYPLLLWGAGIVALIGVLVILPIRKVR